MTYDTKTPAVTAVKPEQHHTKVAEEHMSKAKEHADLAKKAMPASK
jgi:hypothetical protein